MSQHEDDEIRAAIIRLSDALCSYERATGLQSILIIREQNGFCYRAISGKPDVPPDATDESLLAYFD